ncbi:hypothetical protein FHR90_001498 [Endobacter medicaginis]|uniref:Uncharacterized protein n=1 Tax=Endobacter medicaginis TaxID=1181271 RepID=A0A839UYH7_9PROT|nr:hypothetical protein [Endobacter medicaginis]MBB3173675.1 hypothetical protein [Endobacter medicaginis]MCX5477004.1 hypothetical protein [Endobacter medicaginis]NVN31287.1 hypothetical protein [Endobacter medicaginis]
MDDVKIEQLGGVVGGFSPTSHVHSEGHVAWSALSAEDRARLDALFAKGAAVNANLRYRLTRQGPGGPQIIEATPEMIPDVLLRSITTTID